ncbi:hypothetical protein F3J18_31625, partial [Burkholderia sp. Ax-1720]|nr:hypothetical protein [Burkholderia sp. Ax-1720]
PDDVSARLPAKYRRAYRYVLDNLDRADLSVREIATQIGVTERTKPIQAPGRSVMKAQLPCSAYSRSSALVTRVISSSLRPTR